MTPAVDPIVVLIRRARVRFWVAASLRAALIGAVAGSLSALLAALIRLVAPVVAAPEAVGFGVAGVVVVVRLAVTAVWAPTLIDIARVLDRHHHLHERMSTALEVAAARESVAHTTSMVADAVIEDAVAWSRHVDVGAAGRLTWPRWGWLLPIGLAATTAVMVTAPPPMATVTLETRSVVVDPETERAVLDRTTDTVERLVRLLEQEATHRHEDAYLRAIRESFVDLGERLRGEAIDAESARAILDNLIGHLERASAQSDDVVATLVTGFNPEGGAASGAARPSADQADRMRGADEADPSVDDPASEASRGSPSLEDLVSRLERALEEAERTAADRPQALMRTEQQGVDDFYGLQLNPDEPTPGVMRQDGDAAGAPVGAAEESDDRAGDAAGDGVGDPIGEHAVSLGEGGIQDDVTLVTEEIDGGRRVATEVQPLTAGPRRGGATLDTPLPVHRADEATAGAEQVPWEYMHAVSRYFLPDLAEQVTGP